MVASNSSELISRIDSRYRDADASRLPNEAEYLLGVGLLVRMIINGDIGALACEGDGRGAAHAGVAARD